jgi:DNA-binding response OmpR family regulator
VARSIADKVLVVDDDPAFHKLVESVLTPAGIQHESVHSGEEALRAVTKGTPRAVIIDGLLPGMRGDVVAARLRERWTQAQLPIVFVSAFFRDLRSRKRLLNECQVDAVLHKPITPEELKRALARIPALAPKALPMGEELPDDFELDITTAAEMLTDYLVIAQERVASLRASLAGLTGADPKAALQGVRNDAHKFRGTGGSFGLPEVTRLGAQIEEFIEAQKEKALTPTNRAKISGWVDALSLVLARAGASIPSPGMSGAVRPLRVLLLDGPGELAVSCAEAAKKGAPIRLFADATEALISAAEEAADVIFIAADRDGYDGNELCSRFAKEGLGPVVLMATDSGFQARLEAQGFGARGYVHRLPDAASLLRVAPDFAAPPRGVTVLVVSADHAQLDALAVQLSKDGLAAVPCEDPKTLFETLDQTEPALVLLSTELPGVNGLSLLRALRGDARHGWVPVMALLESRERRERVAALEAGADEVLTFPVDEGELFAQIRVQIRRWAREHRTRPVRGLPGFIGGEELHEEIERALVLARRGRAFSVMVFDAELPHLQRSRGRLEVDAAVAALGARLKVVFRSSDVVASLGGGRFGVLLHDLVRADAERLLQTHLDAFNMGGPLSTGLQVLVRGGLATFPEVQGGARELIEAATKALRVP